MPESASAQSQLTQLKRAVHASGELIFLTDSDGVITFVNLKELYVSGFTDDTITRQGQLKPGVEFLQKPLTADALNRRGREALDR